MKLFNPLALPLLGAQADSLVIYSFATARKSNKHFRSKMKVTTQSMRHTKSRLKWWKYSKKTHRKHFLNQPGVSSSSQQEKKLSCQQCLWLGSSRNQFVLIPSSFQKKPALMLGLKGNREFCQFEKLYNISDTRQSTAVATTESTSAVEKLSVHWSDLCQLCTTMDSVLCGRAFSTKTSPWLVKSPLWFKIRCLRKTLRSTICSHNGASTSSTI